jgi:hypothetical protein
LRRSALLLVGVALLAGCAGSQQPAKPPVVTIDGGTALEQDLMKEVIRGFDPKTIGSVKIERQASGPALDLSMTHALAGDARVRPGWEDWIVAAAFAHRLVLHGFQPTIKLVEPDSGDQIYPRHERNPNPKLASAAQARATADRFRSAAERAGANVVEVHAGRPYGIAPSVTLQVSNPARFLENKLWQLLKVYDRNRNTYEGYYVGIVDEQGREVLEAGNSTRVQGGSYWVRPDLDSCSPIMHSHPAMAPQPPPCPA